jgi:hypothetical protein
MKPTIGRIVHYKLTDDEISNLDGIHNNKMSLLPAIITTVWSDTCINVQVFVDGHKGSFWKTSINEGSEAGSWSWPTRE